MRIKRKIGLLTAMLLLVRILVAQENWSLNQCIDYALQNNLTHHIYALDEQTAKIDATQSRLNLLPSLSASSSTGLSVGRSVDPNTNDIVNTEFFNHSNSLNSSLILFRGFIQQNQISWSKFKLKAAQWQKVNYQDDLAFQILLTYYDVVYYQGLVDIAREQLSLSAYDLRKAEAMIETGLKAKSDLAEIQALYEKEMLSLIQAENKAEGQKLSLARQMNLPAGQLAGIRTAPAKPVAYAGSVSGADSLFTSFVQFSPYVKIAEAELQAAAKELAMTRGQYLPSVYLNASVNTGYYETYRDSDGKTISFSDQLDNNLSQYIGASVSIPLFQKNQLRSQVRKAELAEEQARTQLETYRQTVYYELVNNTRELQALFREFIQTEKQAEADQLAYQVAQRKYDEGLIDVIELLAVKSRLTEAQSQLLRAQLQWEIKDKVLGFYKGVRFWE
ncbi:TolC family protein [uncultured Sunxiuqinia sp.]|uniref:TolC family protein n=1 Tax=uncultured Sunxiuqinia sp. TaxID=1573825 RepID=UPI0030D98B3E